MTTYTYSIFDGNPATSGPCAWPAHDDVEIEADSDEAAVEEAASIAEVEMAGLDDEEYSEGSRIWVIVSDEDGTEVGRRVLTVEALAGDAAARAECGARAARGSHARRRAHDRGPWSGASHG